VKHQILETKDDSHYLQDIWKETCEGVIGTRWVYTWSRKYIGEI